MTDKPKRQGPGMRLRTYFLTGMIIVAPIAITAYLTWSFILWVDGWVKPYIPLVYNPDYYLPFTVPGFGLLMALFLITLIGFLTANLVGRSVISVGEMLLDRMPLVRSLYKGLKQIFQTVLAEQSGSFKQAGLIQYPRQGLWSIVFIATDTRGEVRERLPVGESMSVFLPTTPNPTSGFLLFVPREDVLILDMSVEEAAKMVISAGLVSPDFPKTLPIKSKPDTKTKTPPETGGTGS
ncbi:DUF502 domain-containing protein [Hoeflea sp.]|uniref:DUF502 domain-containing protein n=1 Tax=Hoeflea sp. TaxID=1940281 RepID=UPI002AFEC07B|nr:DUF502 domain-containing protein [Hoeflea sp.]